jgi:hypothetical protein
MQLLSHMGQQRQQPDLSKIRVYGLLEYAVVPPEQQRKIDGGPLRDQPSHYKGDGPAGSWLFLEGPRSACSINFACSGIGSAEACWPVIPEAGRCSYEACVSVADPLA